MRQSSKTNTKSGRTIAAILAGAWRRSPPLTVSAADLETAVPLLLKTGTAGLAYRRLGRTATASSPGTRLLGQAYRLHRIEAAIHRKHLHDLLTALRSVGIEPLIVKGWSMARLYPEAGLRPYGDIDLCVRPQDLAGAASVLTEAAGKLGSVDLHAGVADLDRSVAEIHARSRLVPLTPPSKGGDNERFPPLEGGERGVNPSQGVRILGAEDQLRHLCLHLMRHGAWRALWLCDVAIALESLPREFEWDYCLSGDPRLTEWVVCTIGLARRLLGAQVGQPEIAGEDLPGWLSSSVLESWGRGAESNDAVRQPFAASLSNWAVFRDALRSRWPNPIRAAFKLRHSPFGRSPLLPIQLTAFLLRGGQYAWSRLAGRQPAAQAFETHPLQVR